MSTIHFSCESTGSTDRAIALTLRLANSSFSLAVGPSSVVHTGVKSAGCENSTPQLSPSHWWKLIVPSVDSWVKSGARSPSWIAIYEPPYEPWERAMLTERIIRHVRRNLKGRSPQSLSALVPLWLTLVPS